MQSINLKSFNTTNINVDTIRISPETLYEYKDWDRFFDALELNKTIKVLNLGNIKLDELVIEKFANVLINNNTLEELNFYKCSLHENNILFLIESLKANKSIKNLYLGFNNISLNILAESLGELIALNRITSLNLHNTQFNNILNSFASNLNDSCLLSELYLGRNKINSNNLKNLIDYLKKTKHLKILNLEYNNIDEVAVNNICESLNYNNSLESLDLSNNYINHIGAKSISTLLLNNKSLIEINLSYNRIENEGAKFLSNSLKKNKTLVNLYLNSNTIDNLGLEYIYESITTNIDSPLLNLTLNINKFEKNNSIYLKINNLLRLKRKLSFIDFKVRKTSMDGLIIPNDKILFKIFSFQYKLKKNSFNFQYQFYNQLDFNKWKESRQSIIKIMEKIYYSVDTINYYNEKIEFINLNQSDIDIKLSKIFINSFRDKIESEVKICCSKLDAIEFYTHSEYFIKTLDMIYPHTSNFELELLNFKKKINECKRFSSLYRYNNFKLNSIQIELNTLDDIEKAWNILSKHILLYNRKYSFHIHFDINNNIFKLTKFNIIKLQLINTKRYNTILNNDYNLFKLFLKLVDALQDIHYSGIELNNLNPNMIYFNRNNVYIDIDYQYYVDNTFIAPERKNLDNLIFGKSDIYSLGVLFFIFCLQRNNILININKDIPIANLITNSRSLFRDEWFYNLILSMINSNPSSRLTLKKIGKEIKKYLYNDLLYGTSIDQFKLLLQFRKKSRIYNNRSYKISRNNIIQNFTKIFNNIKNINISTINNFKFIGETGVGDGVFRDSLEVYLSSLFNINNLEEDLFVYNHDYGFYSPNDLKEYKNEMEALGVIIFHCIILGYPLHMKLTPLVYCKLVNKIENTTEFVLRIIENFDSILVNNIKLLLNDTNEEQFILAKELIDYKKKDLFGGKFRMINIEHIYNGFKKFMFAKEYKKLIKGEWKELELLCCGHDKITSGMILECLDVSLSNDKWYINSNSKTKDWFIEWINSKNSDELRNFLRLCTGLSTITDDFKINATPSMGGYIRTYTCAYEIKIPINRNDKNDFFNMMDESIQSLDQIED